MSTQNGNNKPYDLEPELLTAYALGQLAGDELTSVEAALAAGDEDAQRAVREAKSLAASIRAARGTETLPIASTPLRESIVQRCFETAPADPAMAQVEPAPARKPWRRRIVIGTTIAAALMLLFAVLLPHFQVARESARRTIAMNDIDARFSAVSGQPTVETAVEGITWEKAERTKQVHSTTTDLLAENSDLNEWKYAPTELATGAGAAPVARPAPYGDQRSMTRNPHPPAGFSPGQPTGGEGGMPYSYPTTGHPQPFRGRSGPGAPVSDPQLAQRQEANNGSGPRAGLGRFASDNTDPQAVHESRIARGEVSPRIVITEEYGEKLGVPANSGQSAGAKNWYYREARTPTSDLDLAATPAQPVAAGFEPLRPGGMSGGEVVPEVLRGTLVEAEVRLAKRVREFQSSRKEQLSAHSPDDPKYRERDAQDAAERAEIQAEAKKLADLRKYASQYELARTELLRRQQRPQFERATGEQYDPIVENAFLNPRQEPLSTFSIDVDTASYANVRRFLNEGRLPPPNAVRIEELVNYFRYEYPQPKEQTPFSVKMEVAECPWREGNWLLKVGLKGKEVNVERRPASNLVFLLDVSGSMADANKLPLLKTAMQMLVRELGENDRVAIVTYAGEAGLKLVSTGAHEQAKILAAIESLSSGGSTNGSAGIELAYEQASQHFIKGGTNRVILCTDGDLNVGVTSDDALVKLIKEKAKGGTFLTVLGFGVGNLKDSKMEKLADNGNGLYAYIDSIREARKVLVEQLAGSTITIAKDVKIQIEFNPAQIASYRLLGYENRVLAAQDFNNDKKDAGEIGAGHTVTALYELVPVGAAAEAAKREPAAERLKYQASGAESKVESRKSNAEEETNRGAPLTEAAASGELLTLKLRYKEPEADTSKLLEVPLKEKSHSFQSASPDFQFAASVASFGMILRNSEHRGSGNLAAVQEIAAGAIGKDAGGYRAEFLDLVRKSRELRGTGE